MAFSFSLELLSSPTVLAALVLTLYLIYAHIISPSKLSHIPGPWYTSHSTLPLLYWITSGSAWSKYGHLCQEYNSDLIRIAPGHLITGSVKTWKKIYSSSSSSSTKGSSPGYPRSDWFNAMRFVPNQDNTLSMRSEKSHSDLRMKLAAGYGGKEVPDLESKIDEQVLSLISLINRKYISNLKEGIYKPMDFARKSHFFTLDVISSLAFGESFGDLRDDNDNHGYLEQMEQGITLINIMAVLPKLYLFLEKSKILALVGPSERDDLGLGKAYRLAKELVGRRFRNGDETPSEDRKDMMGSFFRHGMKRSQVESEVVLQILAGSDTTATAVRSVLLNVVSCERVYRRLMKEIGEKMEGVGEEEVIRDSTARGMKYLQACIKEGLRIAPPVSGLFSHEVPAGGDEVDGYFVPGGTRIGWSTYAMTRNPSLFGPDEHCFRPERWLLHEDGGDCESAAKLREMDQNNEVIFGYGRFKCLGQPVALMELNKIFVELLQRFDFQICDPKKPYEVDFQIGVWTQIGLWMTVTRREERV
ncbi:Averantin hydroxylase [Cercospora beticola]|uniref:Averantin hydroxylase n=1 Tax=Cercospora beticola TaxID=122368 RepID=A0A2G5HU30_CERBT|nr:Averantin hydroxylase [Cercospora beticola]PIA96035.1 Averantin hydroxylase [Cercospora beticola]WPB06880.1 hypothetical protein RHO25_011540 [Cercospora beticola]